MSRFLERLRREVILFDGAMGTMLQQAGLAAGECPELWNLERPEVVQGIHRAYLEAGAQVVETNTFGANRIKLGAYGLQGKVRELNYWGARLAREVTPEGCFVAGSISPTGRFLQPLGDLSFSEVVEIYQEQIAALIEGGVDLLCVETMMDVEETIAAVMAAHQVGPLPVAATMTFNLGQVGFRTIMGISPEAAIRQLEEVGVDLLGSNCGNGMEEMILLMRQMRPLTRSPLLAQPNAGVPRLVEGEAAYTQGPEEFARGVPELLATGVNAIGGCCGTTPAHIRRVAREMRKALGAESGRGE
jgi:5-methyltetrahydrofolate--homocysteine methyltransferase